MTSLRTRKLHEYTKLCCSIDGRGCVAGVLWQWSYVSQNIQFRENPFRVSDVLYGQADFWNNFNGRSAVFQTRIKKKYPKRKITEKVKENRSFFRSP
jgi:hypothetical protein